MGGRPAHSFRPEINAKSSWFFGRRVQPKDAFDQASTANEWLPTQSRIKVKAACYHSRNEKLMPIWAGVCAE
jgi:hypothetical protein